MAKKTGRPTIQIDEAQLEKLAAIGCTMKEMSAFVGCSVDTLERRFAELIDKGREQGKSSVRRMIWKHAEANGNSIALKYLIHNVLKEKLDSGLELKILSEQISKMTDEQLFALAKEKLKNE